MKGKGPFTGIQFVVHPGYNLYGLHPGHYTVEHLVVERPSRTTYRVRWTERPNLDLIIEHYHIEEMQQGKRRDGAIFSPEPIPF